MHHTRHGIVTRSAHRAGKVPPGGGEALVSTHPGQGLLLIPEPIQEDHVPLLHHSRSSPVVDVGALLEPGACEYIASLVGAGALVSLFRTRDGGAFGVQVTLDGESEKEYFRVSEELCEWLREVDAAVAAMPQPAPSAKKRSRGA